jgi:nucleotide-binding universal stress UspA family protein
MATTHSARPPLPNRHPIAVVHGTDFSDAARHAGDIAAGLAAALGASLHVVHVVDRAASEEPGATLREVAERSLATEVARLAGDHRVHLQGHVITGHAGREIARYADEATASLIVIGAGAPSPALLRIGDTATRVVKSARVPVLVVRDARPLRTWLRGGGLAVAAFLADDAASSRAIEWLRALRHVGPCDITSLTAYYTDAAARRYGVSILSDEASDTNLEQLLRRELERSVGILGGRGTVSHRPVRAVGRFVDPLLEHPAARDADLIVTGNHRARGLARLASVAAGTLHHATASVLIVPVEAPPISISPWPRLRRIVVATDFSRFAADAVHHAYGLVAATGGEVILVHVLSSSSDSARTEGMDQLRALQPDLPLAGVTSTAEVLYHEDPAVAIVQLAERVAADCIVIASHGRSGIVRAVLGSVASGVLERSRRPVLVVRPPADA